MEASDLSTSSNGHSSLPMQFSSYAGTAAADASHGDVVVATSANTETGQTKRRKEENAATNVPQTLTSYPSYFLSSITDTAGHEAATATAGETMQGEAAAAATRENPNLWQVLRPAAAGMDANEGGKLKTAAISLVEAAADTESSNHFVLKRMDALLDYKQTHTAHVSSNTQHSFCLSPAGATAPVRGHQQQQQQHWVDEHQQEEQLQLWTPPQERQRWWPDHLLYVQKHHHHHPQVQHLNREEDQGHFNGERMNEEQKQPQLSRERQGLQQQEMLGRAQRTTDIIRFQTGTETTNVSRQTLHIRYSSLPLRSACGTMRNTQEQARWLGKWHEQPKEDLIHCEQQKCRQSAQTEDIGKHERPQRLQLTPSHHRMHSRFPSQFTDDTPRLPAVQSEEEEEWWQRREHHHGGQQEEKHQIRSVLSAQCILPEVDQLGPCQQHRKQGCEDRLLQQQYPEDQTSGQKHPDQQAQDKQCHLQRIHPNHDQQSHVHQHVKSEPPLDHARAASRKVVAAASNREETKEATADFSSHAQSISDDDTYSRGGTETSCLLADSRVKSHACTQCTSTASTAALAEKKASSAAGAESKAGGRRAFVVANSLASSTAPSAVQVHRPNADESGAAASHYLHSTSGGAVVASLSHTTAVPRGSNTTGSRSAAGAAPPRRKQLSGAQKRKRKRELMAKCRVEQASLLSFLATTVTSDVILNDWYALESQLRDECAYFERLSSSAWNLPAALSRQSSTTTNAADSSPTAARLSASDPENHPLPVAASDDKKLPQVRLSVDVEGEKQFNGVDLPENQGFQDDFHSQQGQEKQHLDPEEQLQQSEKQQREDLKLTRLNDDDPSTETVQQQHTYSGKEWGETGDILLQQMHITVETPGLDSWFNEKKSVAPVDDATDKPSRNLHSSGSPVSSSFKKQRGVSCSSSAHDLGVHLERSASACISNTPEEVDSSSNTTSLGSINPNGDVSQWGWSPVPRRHEDFPSSTGRCQLLSGSTTPCSSSSSTSWESRTPVSQGTDTRSSCKTWTDDNEKSIDNRRKASSCAVEAEGGNQAQTRETTYAAGPEPGHSSISDTVEEGMQPQERQIPLSGMSVHADHVIPAVGTPKIDNRSSEHSISTLNSGDSISSPTCEDASVEEKDAAGDDTVCSDSRSVCATSYHSSSMENNKEKLLGRSVLQQVFEGLDPKSSSVIGADGHHAKCRSLVTRISSVAKGCCHPGIGELDSNFTRSSPDERCCRCESGSMSSSLACVPVPKDMPDTSTHDAAASTDSMACANDAPSSAVGGIAAPVLGNDTRDKSSRVAAPPYGCSLALRSELQRHQHQQRNPLHIRALSSTDPARPNVEEQQLLQDVQTENQLLRKLDSSTTRHYSGEGREDRAEEESHSITRRSLAATVVDTTETGDASILAHCNAHEDPVATGVVADDNSSTASVVTSRMSLSGETIRLPADSGSAPHARPSTQRKRHISQRLSSSESESVAGLLDAWKERTSSVSVDDEASTASSSPAPVLQQQPAPLLFLQPPCDHCERANSPLCASLAEAEIAAAATHLPAYVASCRFPAKLQAQPESLSLPQQVTAQQETIMQQGPVQSEPMEHKPESLISAYPEDYQQAMMSPGQQQRPAEDGLSVHSHQETHEDFVDRRKHSMGTQGSEGTRLPIAQQQQQQCSVSSEAETTLCDPALWPAQISEALRIELVKRGPVQIVDFEFPRDSTQRRFGRQHYWRTATTGERYWRSWLVYSKSRDAVYCFCCRLYSQLSKSAVSTGFRRWKGAAEVLRSHEQSKDHRTCMLQWKCMCVKVGAGVAFGDLMQLWLPNSLSSATTAFSLEDSSASGSMTSATASSSGKLLKKT